jgi:hypothetical protein
MNSTLYVSMAFWSKYTGPRALRFHDGMFMLWMLHSLRLRCVQILLLSHEYNFYPSSFVIRDSLRSYDRNTSLPVHLFINSPNQNTIDFIPTVAPDPETRNPLHPLQPIPIPLPSPTNVQRCVRPSCSLHSVPILLPRDLNCQEATA